MESVNNDIKRLKMVVDWLIDQKVALSNRSLAEKMGYSPSSLSLILNGKVSITEKFVKAICALDSRLNAEWLLSGTGEMLSSSFSGEGMTPINTDNAESIDSLAKRMEYVTMMQAMSRMENLVLSLKSNYESRIAELEREVAQLKAMIK